MQELNIVVFLFIQSADEQNIRPGWGYAKKRGAIGKEYVVALPFVDTRQDATPAAIFCEAA